MTFGIIREKAQTFHSLSHFIAVLYSPPLMARRWLRGRKDGTAWKSGKIAQWCDIEANGSTTKHISSSTKSKALSRLTAFGLVIQ
jgi:hypothetical protein